MAKNLKRSGLVVGVDLGGTNMMVGIVDQHHKIIATVKRKTKAAMGRDAVIDRIVGSIERACEEAGVKVGSVDGVGIGAPSAIDFEEGMVITQEILDGSKCRFARFSRKDLECQSS